MKKRFFRLSFCAEGIRVLVAAALTFLACLPCQTLLARAQAPEPPLSTVDEGGSHPGAITRLVPFQLLRSEVTVPRLQPIFSSDVPLACQEQSIIHGALTADDSIQINRLTRWPNGSICYAPTGCPLQTLYPDPYRYDSFSFLNSTTDNQCVSVTLDATACTGITYLHSSAYIGVYDPTSLCTNYLADLGPSVGIDPDPDLGSPPLPTGSYSFIVGPGQTYNVVVNQAYQDSFCASYTLTVTPECQFVKTYLSLISR